MKRRYHLGLLAVAGLLVLAALSITQADEPTKPQEPAKVEEDPGTLPEVQDVIFFTDKHPVLLRIRLFVDGQPAGERWDTFQQKLFAYLDTNGDGFLDKEEAKHVISAQNLLHVFSGSLFQNDPNGGAPRPLSNAPADFEEMDTNKDGKISPLELADYYHRNGAGPYTVVTGSGLAATADQLTNAIFATLDANKDGLLSKEELLVADKLLMRFDDNDDEMITPQEILATAINPYNPPRRPGTPENTGETSILLVPKDVKGGTSQFTQRMNVAKQVLAKYAKNGKTKVNRAEIDFPKEQFDAIRDDTNKGDEIKAEELFRWVRARKFPPDVECIMRLGRVDDKVKYIESSNDGKGLGGLKLSATSPTTLALSLDSSEVSVMRGAASRAGNDRRMFAQYQQAFKQIDKGGKGYITKTQLQMMRGVDLKPVFEMAVRADSDQMTEKELDAFLDIMGAATGAQLAITFTDNGQGLFDMLDTNRDGRLSIREMRSAWNRLSSHAHDGQIARADIPRQYSLSVGAPQNQNPRGMPVDADMRMRPGNPRPAAPQRGPLWFRKMDLNGDGDVSEREFLGSREDFRRIDTDGDGLISVEEAEKADEWFRQKLEQK
jgi:Ca2+-binding EF-hand superfamily protein